MKSTIPVNWFDFVVLAFVVIGILRGRSRGMSQEVLDLLMWLGIIIGGAIGYKPVASIIVAKTQLELMWAYVLGYLGIVLVVLILKSLIENAIRDKLLHSDLFGSLEYPLGMISGAIRYLCMLLMVLALINAKLVTAEERAEESRKMKEELGKEYFPTFGQIQYSIFNESLSGKIIKDKLGWCLIESTAPAKTKIEDKSKSIKDKKQKELDSVIGK